MNILVFFSPTLTVKITFFETINMHFDRGKCDVKVDVKKNKTFRNKYKHFKEGIGFQQFSQKSKVMQQ